MTGFSQGVNQSAQGTDKVNAIINCHLLTGRIGRPGMGPFSLTGQPNAMGGREVGGLASTLAAHMDFAPENVARVGRFWAAPQMATKPGLKAVDLFRAIGEGRIRALWVMATNPAVSMPDAGRVREALAAFELEAPRDADGAVLRWIEGMPLCKCGGKHLYRDCTDPRFALEKKEDKNEETAGATESVTLDEATKAEVASQIKAFLAGNLNMDDLAGVCEIEETEEIEEVDGGAVEVTSGFSDATSSGNVEVATAAAGAVGVRVIIDWWKRISAAAMCSNFHHLGMHEVIH